MGSLAHNHLSDEEIEECLWGEGITAAESIAANEHLARCVGCQKRVEMHRKAKERLDSLRASSCAANVDCPGKQKWTQVAAGAVDDSEREQLNAHAAGCESCRKLLDEASADLYTPPSQQELQDLEDGLASPPWLADLPERLAAASAHSRRPLAPRYRKVAVWVGIAATALLICGAAWWSWTAQHSPKAAERLLASAYSQERNLELRIAGAPYAEVRMTRGPNSASRFDRPKDLIDAEALIADQRALHPQDPDWLRLAGRADLLAWNYGPAIQALKRADALRPDSPQILVDLASAYFERAQASGHDADYGIANELLSQALRARPDQPLALYNRAIIAERILLYDEAVSDLKRYLSLDPSGGWANQAREQLASLQKKNVQH